MPANSPWDEMERWFDEFARQGWLHPFRWEWPLRVEPVTLFEGRIPKVDVIDRETEVLVRAELPGVEKDGVDVTLTEQSLMLRAVTKHEEKEEEGEYYRHELSHGEFQRTLRLPDAVDMEKAKAMFRNGFEVTLPKRKRPARKSGRIITQDQ
jgi:HSP20 family protein